MKEPYGEGLAPYPGPESSLVPNSRLGTPLRNAVSLSLRASAPPREPSPVKGRVEGSAVFTLIVRATADRAPIGS
jgi:hypothetical protein